MRLKATPRWANSSVEWHKCNHNLPCWLFSCKKLRREKKLGRTCGTICRKEGHHKNECPKMGNYATTEAPNPFPGGGNTNYCEICRKWGDKPYSCQMLEKYPKTTHTPFCEFCKSMGHDIQACHALELMWDRICNVYRVQGVEPQMVEAQNF